ncbi:putative B3 domain-containing protein Os03g0621600 isoform X1 [Lycium barbarum]|uniref:putative B3 domain-containing protein Os03g0621600 isoform X1 n=1 Tax=Lycium barbarum TaxID=112863 RepID=UPI00293EB747|nr:putative B3 domain-containing protein Os03g0621600 isoform X1 [Lycium barbarum]XP_060173157.1 putative B3 domain-containing protein Os03g0621600 isoform X1 [Lycium barbarum]
MVTPMEHAFIPHDLPEFFKIYYPEICYPQLRIPPAFLKFFNGDIPSIAVLEDLAARSWTVAVEKNDCDLFFKGGWPDFVQENNLEFGEFLTFSYAGNSKFYVKIYGKNGSLKQDVIPLKESKLVPLDEENAQEKAIVARPADQTLNGSGHLVASVTSFEVVIMASHLKRARMNFPATFGNRYRYSKREQPLVAILQVGSASWPVNVLSNDRLEIRKGIRKFICDNALRVGDVCRFKLIDEEKFILKVRIM